MKKWYWLFLSLILFLTCVGAGLYTRSSFTDYWLEAKQQLDEVTYNFQPEAADLPLNINASTQSVLEASPVIVLATADRESEFHGKSFLTEMKVEKILKNDGNLTGDRIVVCEPIDLLPTKEVPGMQGTGYTMCPTVLGTVSRTKIVKDQQYLLMLEDLYPDKQESKLPSYLLIHSPYAKLIPSSANNAQNYSKPLWPISYKDASKYEILLQDTNQVQTFYHTKAELLSQLNLK